MRKYIDITGRKFGRLTSVSVVYKNKYNEEYWNCVCDCGNKVVVRKSHLLQGKIVSCKCFQKERRMQGISKIKCLSKTRLYRIWQNMKNRCYYKKHPEAKYWGGKGIEVCKEWKESFINFYEWAMQHGYQDHLSIDRIDSDGNYCPENCRWATSYEQVHNTRRFFKCTVQA